MNLDEFNSLMLLIVDNEFPVREIPIAYNHSIRLQINEIDSDRHLKMMFPEFIEAFCRTIDKYSPFPSQENPVLKYFIYFRKIGQCKSDKISIYQLN
jgi:hypothetical protein